MDQENTPERILQVGMGFWASKTLLSAVELGLFTELAAGPLDRQMLMQRLQLHPRGAEDFFDTLVSLRFLERHEGKYANTAETDLYLDRKKPSYVGGFLEVANRRLYPSWASLTEGLRTGKPQNDAKQSGNLFEAVYADPARLRVFLQAMTESSRDLAQKLAKKFPWESYKTFVDIGAAQGCCGVQIALAHGHLTGGGFDLPSVQPIFEEYIAGFGLRERLRFFAGDFFSGDLPCADVLIMGRILHNWSPQERQLLISKAYQALPAGGALVVYDVLIDDERRENTEALLNSLNMLVVTVGGSEYTGANCMAWMREAGFKQTFVEPLFGSESMVVGIR